MTRILVVDDLSESLHLLQALFGAQGFLVDEAHSGAEALDRARAARPDLVVSDLLMPVMDGITLCRAIRADPDLCAVPILIYTATCTDPREEELARDAGASAFLIKPAEPERMLEVVRAELERACDANRSRSELPATEPEEVFLRLYNSALVRKLEDKLQQLDASNRQLTEGEAFLREVLDSLPAHLMVLDDVGTITAVLRPRKTPAPDDEEADWLSRFSIGDDYLTILRGALSPARGEFPRIARGLADVRTNRTSAYVDHFAVGSGRESRWFAVTASPLRTNAGYLVLTHVEVTTQHDLESLVLEIANQEQRFRRDFGIRGLVRVAGSVQSSLSHRPGSRQQCGETRWGNPDQDPGAIRGYTDDARDRRQRPRHVPRPAAARRRIADHAISRAHDRRRSGDWRVCLRGRRSPLHLPGGVERRIVSRTRRRRPKIR
jgi:CheY-like chemotaxis protein